MTHEFVPPLGAPTESWEEYGGSLFPVSPDHELMRAASGDLREAWELNERYAPYRYWPHPSDKNWTGRDSYTVQCVTICPWLYDETVRREVWRLVLAGGAKLPPNPKV